MDNLHAASLKVEDNTLWLLDQTLLPLSEQWFSPGSVDELYAAIVSLKVRGAPLIGIASALFVALAAEQGASELELRAMIDRLAQSRPTAVNLRRNLTELTAVLSGGPAKLAACAARLFFEEQHMCLSLATKGQHLVRAKDGSQGPAKILTHCNTGSLATIGVGTAVGVITVAAKAGKVAKVWVSETRPLLQGGRLTAYEMVKAGIDHAIITDGMAASLMAAGEVDLVVVGADRIAVNGDVANKIGTYALAVACRAHEVPFYVAAPATTYDPDCAAGEQIPIEQRDPAEVRGFSFPGGEDERGSIRWAPAQSPVYNPAFDVTPAGLVSGYLLPGGVASRPAEITGLLG